MPQGTGTDRTTAEYAPPATSPGETLGASVMLPPHRADDPRLRGRSRLTLKIFLNGATIVAMVLGVTLFATWLSARRAADQSVQRGLEATRDRVRALLSQDQARLASAAQTYVGNTDFRAHLEQLVKQPDSIAAADYLDQAVTVDSVTGASWVQLISPEGILLARSDDSTAAPADLSGSPLVGPALGGTVTTGFGVRGDTALFYAVTVPIYGAGGEKGGSEIGVLMAAQYVNDALANDAGRETGSEVLFYSLDRENQPSIIASTPALADRRSIRQWLASRMMGRGNGGAPADSTRREDAVIAGRHFVGQGSPLLSAAGTPVGGFVSLRDRDAELGAFRQLRTTILYAAAAGLLLAFVLSAFVARQISRPVRALALASSRAADGDYSATIPAAGRDEIGALADAFRDLLADLRDKQALVELLQSPSGGGMDGRTVPIAAVTPTLQQQAMGSGAVLEAGQMLANRYEIVSVLGVGGMGVVYRATDRELGEPLAIKTLRPDLIAQDPSALDRFKSEIRLARRISHRNVVRTHDLGEFGGVYYITMEFVEGKTLKELVGARGRLPAAAVLPIAKQLCRALDVAHQAGVIHRDIKPQNMVVEPGGVLKVMDFGIARLAERTTGHTQTGMIVGTPQYMAPEQLMGEQLDARADLYAVGCVLYECLTGRPPHQADTLVSLITRVIEETPAPPIALASDVPERLSELVMRTLAKDRAARPASADELHDLLAGIG